ncbi:MAG: GIY-YIG nuclease family protein [bacterium]
MLKDIKNIPSLPGVYLFKNSKGNLLYIGKAINLKKRVGSYFNNKNLLNTKTLQLIKNTEKFEYILVESEVEALILEADLIKKFKPKYNIVLKDDKSFKYAQLERDKISLVRSNLIDKKAKIYGPFPYGGTAEFVLKTLRKVFPFRDCSHSKFSKYQKINRPCLYGYTNYCPAPCVSQTGKEINIENIKQVNKMFSQRKNKIIEDLKKEMVIYSNNLDYEKAKIIRDEINKLQNMKYEKTLPKYLENPNLFLDKVNEELVELKRVLGKTNKTIKSLNRIEFYDISNISGKWAVGSMVVAKKGIIAKDQYRRFKIKNTEIKDDVGMMKEVLIRRFKHKEWDKPDLVVLDGGKPQLSVVGSILELKNIPVLGLAKKRETIFYYEENTHKFLEVSLLRSNKALHLLQRLRDEAHRFAIFYHRKLRIKEIS